MPVPACAGRGSSGHPVLIDVKTWIPACAGRSGIRCALPSVTDRLVKQPTLRRPHSLAGPGLRPRRIPLPPLPNKNRGRAGRCSGPDGPAGLDASRHRGLSKLIVPQVRQFPWRPARGVYRFTPHRPRWTYLSGDRTSLSIGRPPIHRCWPRSSLRSCDRMQRDAITGPGGARLARRDAAAWTAGWGIDAASPTPPNRPPLPAPRLETADPSVARGGMDRTIVHGLKARQQRYLKKILSPFGAIYPRASHVTARTHASWPGMTTVCAARSSFSAHARASGHPVLCRRRAGSPLPRGRAGGRVIARLER